jgi:hypothetical protein
MSTNLLLKKCIACGKAVENSFQDCGKAMENLWKNRESAQDSEFELLRALISNLA